MDACTIKLQTRKSIYLHNMIQTTFLGHKAIYHLDNWILHGSEMSLVSCCAIKALPYFQSWCPNIHLLKFCTNYIAILGYYSTFACYPYSPYIYIYAPACVNTVRSSVRINDTLFIKSLTFLLETVNTKHRQKPAAVSSLCSKYTTETWIFL